MDHRGYALLHRAGGIPVVQKQIDMKELLLLIAEAIIIVIRNSGEGD